MAAPMAASPSRGLRVHAFSPRSRANGHGVRAVVWVQGCTLGCPGCFNPAAQPRQGGELVAVDDLFRRIIALADSIHGVTLSGGEPLQQVKPVLALLESVRKKSRLSVVLFTGYEWEEFARMKEADRLIGCSALLLIVP